MAASYPNSIKSFTTHIDGDTLLAADINAIQDEVVALETQLETIGSWVPTQTGFSSAPAGGIYNYLVIGSMVLITICQPTDGVSNTSGFSITLPFTAKTITNMAWVGFAKAVDNSASLTTPASAVILSGGTVVTLYKDGAGAGWTNVNNKRCVALQMWYQKA